MTTETEAYGFQTGSMHPTVILAVLLYFLSTDEQKDSQKNRDEIKK